MDNLERNVLDAVDDDGKLMEDLLNEAERNIDDSDEAVVVGEVISNPGEAFAKFVGNEDDDDDCVILDSDPDKPVAIENNGGNDSGELCLVGENGEVACRDYPHPRHLCVKFPFNSTPHEKHCEKCHCLVCDLVAPCVHWGNGVSNFDHCHATEKNAFWEAHRKGAKASHKAPPFVPEVGLTPMNEVPSLHSNPLMINQPCSVASTGAPYGVMPVRTQESRRDPSNKFHPFLVGYHLQRQSVGHAGIQLGPQHVPFKRPGTFGGILTPIRYLNCSSRNNYGYQFSVNESLGSRWQDPIEMEIPMLITYECTMENSAGVATNSGPNSSTCLPIGIGIGNYAPLQPQVYPRIHSGSVNANSAVPHPQLSSQTCIGSNLGNLMPSALGLYTQQSLGNLMPSALGLYTQQSLGNPMSLQIQAASQPSVYQNVVPTQLMVTTRGNTNFLSESPTNFYGETSLSQNSQYLPAESTQPISQTYMGDNLGNLMPTAPGADTQQSLGNPVSLQTQAAFQPNVYQNVVPNQLLVTSHGIINYLSVSPANFYGETYMIQNSQYLPAESIQAMSQTYMSDNLGNLMPTAPGVHTQQSLGNLMPLQTQAAFQPNVYQNIAPNQLLVSHGIINYLSESPVNFYGESYVSRTSQYLPAESIQAIYQTIMGDNLGNLMPTAPGVDTQRSLGNPMPLQTEAPSQPNVYQNVVPTQLVVTSHGSINFLSESPVNFYGEAYMSQNCQYLPAESTQLISQTCMGDNLGDLMPTAPGVDTQQSLGNLMSLQTEAASQPIVHQDVVPTQLLVTSRGSINYLSESPVNFYGETSLSQNNQSLPAESTQSISQTCMGDNLGNPMPGLATLQRFHYLCNSEQLPGEMSQNVVPTQPQVTSHGNAESPVTFQNS